MRSIPLCSILLLVIVLPACGDDDDASVGDAGSLLDAATHDAAPPEHDAGVEDAGADGGDPDAGEEPPECLVDDDCSDDDVCTGIERCIDEACVPGMQLGCFDGVACSFDTCDPTSGCAMSAPDADLDGADDCNDCAPSDPDVHPGATDTCNGRDDDCDLAIDENGVAVYFADCDDDGHAPRDATTYTGCEPPDPSTTGCDGASATWITRAPTESAFDCDDSDVRAHAGQTELFATRMQGHVTGLDFDFDCDGRITLEHAAAGGCARSGGTCEHTAGWAAAEIPGCGGEATFVAGCDPSCAVRTEPRIQRCR
ncbi:putative metal-binding motif-containing protein [Sandaracinus amylolyticus]|uniref:putative metal-binding motif-containing protein n=1 Tax=Sandaracinus amylolyticus TaxID=927083 RepID=UPI001F47BCE0|nr:putative metal-binding motif-containing protein [Sandaracinus amylolyticus]